MNSTNNLTAGIITLVLAEYFPSLIFIPNNNANIDKIHVQNYFVQKQGKWKLDIIAMSKSKEKYYSCLFPKKTAKWDEEKAKTKYGNADVIKFFIDAENENFLIEFNKLANSGNLKINDDVPALFFNKMNFDSLKPVWEAWDFSGIVMHKMRHKPPNIYEAFGFFGHRQYTLLGFIATFDIVKAGSKTTDELIKTANNLLFNKIYSEIPDVKKFDITYQTIFFEMVQETLESTAQGKTAYTPTQFETVIKQIKSRLTNIHKNSPAYEYTRIFTAGDKKTINNHIIKIGQYIDPKEHTELNNVKLRGTFSEKINYLHSMVYKPEIKKHYSERELEIIHGLFLKQQKTVSLDDELSNDENDSFTRYDTVSDSKYLTPEDQIIWSGFFKDEFKNEFDEKDLNIFIDCLPDHFSQYPVDIDEFGIISMNKYSKKMLFKTFCSIARINEDEALWKPFLVMLQRIFNNINEKDEL